MSVYSIFFVFCFGVPTYMVINVSVQYNGGFPPEIILLTLFVIILGNPSNNTV